jgi:hypothetical protein
MADGYWYFYDHPMDGPPDVVSDVEYADPSIEQVAAPPPGVEYPPPPPGPPPPPPGEGAVGGAVGGAVVGGVLGGLLTGRPGGAAVGAIVGGTTGAVIGAQAEQRHGYYLWQGVCYYRYPSGQYAAVDPRYCNWMATRPIAPALIAGAIVCRLKAADEDVQLDPARTWYEVRTVRRQVSNRVAFNAKRPPSGLHQRMQFGAFQVRENSLS